MHTTSALQLIIEVRHKTRFSTSWSNMHRVLGLELKLERKTINEIIKVKIFFDNTNKRTKYCIEDETGCGLVNCFLPSQSE